MNNVGWDDYLALAALVVHIVYTILVHIATGYGLGRLFADVGDPAVYFTAVKWEVFSQVAGLAAIGIGKCSVAVFLLRIVRNKLQIFIIWFFVAATTFITIFSCIVVVIQCLPVEKTWNPTAEGYCWLDFAKVGLSVGSWFVVMDFAFAIFPWFIIWDLNMKRKEKITVACGLSLGVFAGICGIVRTVALNGLNAEEYIFDTVDMLIWSATESLVTLMCSSIPVLRPLYVRIKYGSKGDSSNNSNSYNLPQYSSRKYALGSNGGGIGQRSGNHRAVITYNKDNASDETILRDTKLDNDTSGGIKRTDEISVSYEAYNKKS